MANADDQVRNGGGNLAVSPQNFQKLV